MKLKTLYEVWEVESDTPEYHEEGMHKAGVSNDESHTAAYINHNIEVVMLTGEGTSEIQLSGTPVEATKGARQKPYLHMKIVPLVYLED